jgi:hypothetical protein
MNMRIALNGMALVLAVATTAAAGPAAAEVAGSLTGDWSGTSVCADNHDTCRDEEALYHLKGPNERNVVSIVGSKIVDGREIVMGPPSDFQYDPQRRLWFSRAGTVSFASP